MNLHVGVYTDNTMDRISIPKELLSKNGICVEPRNSTTELLVEKGAFRFLAKMDIS
jgi:hypothetical protein